MEYENSLISISESSDDDFHIEKCCRSDCSDYSHLLLSQLSNSPLKPLVPCSSSGESEQQMDDLLSNFSELETISNLTESCPENGTESTTQDIYELPLFSEDEQSIQCVFCHDVIWPNSKLCSRGHLMCSEHTQVLTLCPKMMNKGDFCHKEIIDIGKIKFLQVLFNGLTFECRNKDRGCNDLLLGVDIGHHEEFECRYKPVFQCVFSDCQKEIEDDKFASHVLEEHSVHIVVGDKVPFSCILNFNVKEESYFSEGNSLHRRVAFGFRYKDSNFAMILEEHLSEICMWIVMFEDTRASKAKRYFGNILITKVTSAEENGKNFLTGRYLAHSSFTSVDDIKSTKNVLKISKSELRKEYVSRLGDKEFLHFYLQLSSI